MTSSVLGTSHFGNFKKKNRSVNFLKKAVSTSKYSHLAKPSRKPRLLLIKAHSLLRHFGGPWQRKLIRTVIKWMVECETYDLTALNASLKIHRILRGSISLEGGGFFSMQRLCDNTNYQLVLCDNTSLTKQEDFFLQSFLLIMPSLAISVSYERSFL